MAEAGWYTDPEDDGSLRYFDGQVWTEHRQPAGPVHEAQPAASWDSNPTWQSVGFPIDQAAAPGQAPQKPKRRGRVVLICAVVAVVVAGLLTGGWYLFLRSGPSVTYQGHPIDNAAGVLTTAESTLSAIVTKRHGAKASDTRCYYAVPKTPAQGAKKTDVDSDLRCGPVLFVDGDASQSYLNFGLSNSQNSGNARLASSPLPEVATPAAVPTELTLKRPDGKTPPSGSGGLTPPPPPSADTDALVSADIGSQGVPKAPNGAVMGSLTGGISLTNLGPVTRYGHGDDARSAPAGETLIAFKTAGAEGNDETSSDLSAKATVSIDGGAGRPLPARSAAYYVLAVPTTAKKADLVLSDGGLSQSLSLLDGKPGAGNIAVLARQNRTVTSAATTPFTFTYAPEVEFSDGTGGTSQTATAQFTQADLSYVDDGSGTAVTASSPSTAILFINVHWTGTHDQGPFGFPASLVTFTPTGGTAVAAKDVGGASKDYLLFEVPAGLTTGTITISGSATLQYADATGSYKESVPTAVTMPFSLPAG
jgi:hypothetical protein